jgi:hypothetical protein
LGRLTYILSFLADGVDMRVIEGNKSLHIKPKGKRGVGKASGLIIWSVFRVF